jgi:hypothetical protein
MSEKKRQQAVDFYFSSFAVSKWPMVALGHITKVATALMERLVSRPLLKCASTFFLLVLRLALMNLCLVAREWRARDFHCTRCGSLSEHSRRVPCRCIMSYGLSNDPRRPDTTLSFHHWYARGLDFGVWQLHDFQRRRECARDVCPIIFRATSRGVRGRLPGAWGAFFASLVEIFESRRC